MNLARSRLAPLSITLLASLLASLPAPAAAQRKLTLEEAVELAMAADPSVAQARIVNDRARLSVLRSQLDRVSVTVDGTLRELWNKSNIGGEAIFNCTIGPVTYPADPDTCASMGGVSSAAPSEQQSPSFWQGLSNIKAQVSVPIFSGFRVSSAVALRKHQEESSLALIRQSRRDLALAVARSYWAVRRVEMQRDVLIQVLERYREMETVARARVRAGLAPPIDENRATLKRLQQEAMRNDLEGQARELRPQLALVLGVYEDIELVDSPRVPDGAVPALDDLVARAGKSRPELARAQLAVEAQQQVVRIATADWYPQLTAVGLFQFGNNLFNAGSGASSISTQANPFANLSGSVAAGLQLNVNFFNMLGTYNNVKDARFELARLVEELRLVRRNVELDVQVVRARLQHFYSWRQPLVAQLALARDNLVILEARYKNGDALVIEALEAQADLTAIERQLTDLAALIHLAWLELDAALGNTVGNPQ